MLEFYLIGVYLVFTTQMQQCQSKNHRDMMDFKTIALVSAASWIIIIAQAIIIYVHSIIERYMEEDNE